MATKAREAFRTISEVANWLDVPAHVLRFWESKFSQIKPVKRAGGRRYYRPSDMELIGGIKKLLHDDGLTIRGVQKMLKEEGVKKIAALSPPIETISDQEAAERRAARRARRAAKRVAKQSPENAQIEDAQTIVPDGKREAEVVELSSVQAQKADADDNVVPLTRREQRRASLEEQAAQLDKEQVEAVQEEQTTEVGAPELDFGAPGPAPEAAPTEKAPNEAEAETPDEEAPQLEDRAPLEDAQVSEASPTEIAPEAEGAGEPDELEPAAEATAELSEAAPEPEDKPEVAEAPEPEDIEISETKIAALATTQALRERDELAPAKRDRANELYERLAALRDRIVQDSEQP